MSRSRRVGLLATRLALILCSLSLLPFASLACETDDDCRFHLVCIDGVCTNRQTSPKFQAAKAEQPPIAKLQAAAPEPPPEPLLTTGAPPQAPIPLTARLPDVAYHVLSDPFPFWILLPFWAYRRTRFRDLEGERLIGTALVWLNSSAREDPETARDLGALVARLRRLDKVASRRHRKLQRAMPPLLKRLIAHPRFAEIEAMASPAGFPSLRGRL